MEGGGECPMGTAVFPEWRMEWEEWNDDVGASYTWYKHHGLTAVNFVLTFSLTKSYLSHR